MKRLILLILLLICNHAFADSLTAKIEPANPVMGESFYLYVFVETDSKDEPYISFDKGRLEVFGKENLGVTVRSVLANGRLSTTRSIKYRYEINAVRSGSYRIRDIKAVVEGTELRADDISFRVLTKAKQAPDIFVMAVPSKNQVYIGEGFNVTYYLYYKNNYRGAQLSKFPKLNDFIKRFHQTPENTERVQYDGQIYLRIPKYSARVYAEKTGKLKIDPLVLKVSYSDRRGGGSVFDPFGFSNMRLKTRSLKSAPVTIDVLPLPAENVPPTFTGLVGTHDFNLTINNTKFLNNEPIEYKLEVVGPGALEKMDEPVLYQDPKLESFDVKSSVEELTVTQTKKVFEYTLIGRGNVSIPKKEVVLHTFDPNTQQYVPNIINLPELQVSAVSSGTKSSAPRNNVPSASVSTDGRSSSLDQVEKPFEPSFIGPTLGSNTISSKLIKRVNLGLFILTVLVLASFLVELKPRNKLLRRINKELGLVRKGKAGYSEVHKVINTCFEFDTSSKSLKAKIEDSALSDDAKDYFLDLVESKERTDYYNGSSGGVDYESRYFKELFSLANRNENLQ